VGYLAHDPGQIGRFGSDRLRFLAEDRDRSAHLLFGVLRRQEEAQPSRPFGNGGIEDRLHIDAALEHRLGQTGGADRAAGNNGHDRRPDRTAGVEPRRAGQFEEQPGALIESPHSIRFLFEDLERAQRRRRGGRRDADRKDKTRRHALQVVDQVLSTGNVPTARDEAFAQRAHPDVDLARVDPGSAGRTETARPEDAQSMRLIDHQPGAMPPRHRDKGGEVRHIAIHAVMSLDDEEGTAVARPRLGQRLVGRLGIEVAKRDAPRARQHRALHDAVVNERVMHDDIIAPEQMADHGHVRRMTANQRDAVLGTVNPRQRAFQFTMNRPLAGNRAARRDRGAVAVDCRFRGVGDAGIAVKSDIIVRGEIEVGAVADQRFGAGDALVHAKERIADAEILRGLLDQANFPIGLQLGDIEPLRSGIRNSATRRGRAPSRRRNRGQLLQ